ncbi:hypothetical protein QYS48_12865 [Marivirga arenosa]|uniref:Uncharacterized protein n=1 Tax=Marivirga arenosa TaxID=3059076 RepID=A0AA49GJ25_9BACT|nr:hypothetical protein [Marivirga sp. ABR2-2]WKK87519.1 hypothetical protein QYS48_12865 [Marivirga sp. ABR2-2]
MKNVKKVFAAFVFSAFVLSSLSVFAQQTIKPDHEDKKFDGNDCCSGSGNCIVGPDFC